MKQKIKKWIFRLFITVVLLLAILLTFVLNPTLLYGNKTVSGNYTVYHNKALDKSFHTTVSNATKLLESSEIYNSKTTIDVCLNDGSFYPKLIELFQAPAFGIGFYNKVILMGDINWKDNYEVFNGYKWNLTQLITHEVLHCLQFSKFGLWKSNPIANYPSWKWEGYNEYIARQNHDQTNLLQNITRFNTAEKNGKDQWGIQFADSTYVGRYYYKWWILMQYCKDIKKMTYVEILQDTRSEQMLQSEMMTWYRRTR
jgi:hypothetical protein